MLYFSLEASISSPPPAKKRVGRPTKLFTSDQVRDIIEKYHDFHKMVDFSKKYEQLMEIHYKSSGSVIDKTLTRTRRRFTQKKKEEIRLHYSVSGSYCETAKAFDINELTVRSIIDASVPDEIKPSSKGNFLGAGRPLTYPIELDDELLKWIFVLRDCNFPLSVMSLQEKAKLLIQPHNPSFNASRGWVRKFFNRHKLALRSRTSISQKLSEQLEDVLSKFYEDAARFMRIGKYPLSLIRNMDETPAFFDMVPSKRISKKGEKECVVRSSGSEKKAFNGCFVSHSRWKNASPNDHFQREN